MEDPIGPEDEAPKLGTICEQIAEYSYQPDDLTLDRWDRLFRSPHICAASQEQIERILRIRVATIQAAAIFLRLCPNSCSLDRALLSLQDSQIQAVTAIQANE